MIISHNMSSLFASRQENINQGALQKTMEKLSSGEKINHASDDASGLTISEKMRSQIRGLNKASENILNGVSFIQVSEGYLNETTDILQRIRELAVQSSNGIYTDEDRVSLQTEVSSLVAEVDRIASQAQFNGMNIFTGAFAKDSVSGRVMQFQVGANMDQNMSVYIGTMTATALGLKNVQDSEGIISLATPESANAAIGTVDEALKSVSKQRADLGAYQNRMETANNGILNTAENLTAADSKIRDTDFATEAVELAKNQILVQTSAALAVQASNVNTNAVLGLLR